MWEQVKAHFMVELVQGNISTSSILCPVLSVPVVDIIADYILKMIECGINHRVF